MLEGRDIDTAGSIGATLQTLGPGTVRLVVSDDVDETLSRLERVRLDRLRWLVVAWDELPGHGEILDDALDQLARAALALWPDWYVVAEPAAAGESLGEENAGLLGAENAGPLEDLWRRAEAAGLKREVSPAWLRRADAACRAGRVPRVEQGASATLEARQLGMALGGGDCRLLLAARETAPRDLRTAWPDASPRGERPGRLLGLARAAEWLARETSLATAVLVGRAAARSPELDSINFDPLYHTEAPPQPSDGDEPRPRDEPPPTPDQARPPPELEQRGGKETARTKPRLFVRPIIGRPHPDSPGEQLLWSRMQGDSELAGLFRCNVWAETVDRTTHLVDFEWRSGKLIVEVDGFRWHTTRHAFSHDRRRDFELAASGYTILRLPHDEVIRDVEEAVERVRRLVRMKRTGGTE